MAGVWRGGRGGETSERGEETRVPRALAFHSRVSSPRSLVLPSPPLRTPATQAKPHAYRLATSIFVLVSWFICVFFKRNEAAIFMTLLRTLIVHTRHFLRKGWVGLDMRTNHTRFSWEEVVWVKDSRYNQVLLFLNKFVTKFFVSSYSLVRDLIASVFLAIDLYLKIISLRQKTILPPELRMLLVSQRMDK